MKNTDVFKFPNPTFLGQYSNKPNHHNGIYVQTHDLAFLQRKPEIRPIVLGRHIALIRILRGFRAALSRTVLLVQLLVFPHENQALSDGDEGDEEHKRRADAHTLDVAGRVCGDEDVGAENRPALTDEVDQDERHAATGVVALVI